MVLFKLRLGYSEVRQCELQQSTLPIKFGDGIAIRDGWSTRDLEFMTCSAAKPALLGEGYSDLVNGNPNPLPSGIDLGKLVDVCKWVQDLPAGVGVPNRFQATKELRKHVAEMANVRVCSEDGVRVVVIKVWYDIKRTRHWFCFGDVQNRFVILFVILYNRFIILVLLVKRLRGRTRAGT